MIRRSAVLVTTSVLALGLAACGDAADDVPEPTVPESPPETPDDLVPGADPTADTTERPSPGECTTLPTDEDGDYAVADAGTARVYLEVDELVVDEVEPAEGWEHEVSAERGDPVSITFTGDGETLVLEVAVGDDGLADAQLCAE